MQAKANLFKSLLVLPVVLLAVLLVASAPALGQEYDYPLTVPSPDDQETEVYRDTSVRMYFLGSLDPTTVNADTFKLVEQGTTTPVEATVAYFDWCAWGGYTGIYYCAAELDPQADLGANTTYTATVKGGVNGVKWASDFGYPLGTQTMPEDYSWSFTTGDTTRPPDPPETTITSGPCGPFYTSWGSYQIWPCKPTTSTSATFAFTSSKADSTFECSLDSAAFTSCTSPKAYTGLSDGTHTFQVRATDTSGNTDPTPAGDGWTVDKTAPTGTVSIKDGASSTRTRSVKLTLSATDPSPGSGVREMRVSNTESGLSSASWEAYSTSKAWTLTAGKGTKTVYVQYRDGVGNESAVVKDTIRFRK